VLKLRILVAVVVVCALAMPAGILASPGSRGDSDDVPASVDVKALYHNDSGSGSSTQLEYYMESYDNFSNQQLLCDWDVDFDKDRVRDAHVQLSGEFGLAVNVYTSDGRKVAEGSAFRAPVTSPHSSPTSTSSNTVRMVITRSAYEAAGLARFDNDYDYIVQCGPESGPRDNVPDDLQFPGITHFMAGATADKCPGHENDTRPQIVGTSGDDRLRASATNSIVCGLGGNDILTAAPGGGTQLEGGDGLDVICARQSSTGDQVDGGGGIDRARFDDGETASNVERFAPLGFCTN
jgi:hypothetical protein